MDNRKYVMGLLDQYVTRAVRKAFDAAANRQIESYLADHRTFGGKTSSAAINSFIETLSSITPPIVNADLYCNNSSLDMIMRAVEAKSVLGGRGAVVLEVANALHADLPRLEMEAAMPEAEEET